MRRDGLDVTRDRGTVDDVLTHLSSCRDDFVPPLGERVEPAEYARKIVLFAARFEAWTDVRLAALVAAYPRVPSAGDDVYITNVSVLPAFRRSGVASALLRDCLEWASGCDVVSVKLDVDARAPAAVALYEGLGFAAAVTAGDRVRMSLEVTR